ncbi:hypothetical protein FRC03_011294 [Tulasnella sp. 419]|nr:hypothetical protein FRC03_011294 [Tulasnella sp. 419]
MDKLHKAHNDLAEDHKILQRKYAVVASERKSQVEQSSIALQEASTAKKRDADRCASLPIRRRPGWEESVPCHSSLRHGPPPAGIELQLTEHPPIPIRHTILKERTQSQH